MTQTLVFHNPGEIDIRGACIAGLSAKESNSPIGYFGTGLKYAIASILRWNGTIAIYSGISKYTFEIEKMDFRGQEFNQITMNGSKLGFTTEYGKDWKPWQVFRELYANARDEGGGVELSSCNGREGETIIVVSGVSELISAFHDRDNIILPANKVWNFEGSSLKFSNSHAPGLYYRGVRVWDQPALFTWNFLTNMELTEDRQLKSLYTAATRVNVFLEQELHDIEVIMRMLALKFSDEEILLTRTVELADGESALKQQRPIEGIFMDWWTVPTSKRTVHSAEFQSACCRLYQRNPQTYRELRSLVKSIDSNLVESKAAILTRREQQMFDRAKELVSLFGFKEEIEKLSITVQELGGTTLGLYEHGSIYLSPKLFDQGTKQLVATLYEECYHHRTEQQDCTYNMQTDLFNIIISLNEELNGVIC